MMNDKLKNYLSNVLENMPTGWERLTTHRLDIYEEKLAKTQFIEQFENLYQQNDASASALSELPTAYDYIRLGHPLSSVLEWTIAQINGIQPENVISFSSAITPILAVLRKNLLDQKNTQILYTDTLPETFDSELVQNVYGYQFELKKIDSSDDITAFDGSTILIANDELQNPTVDFTVDIQPGLGSIIIVNGASNNKYIVEIQHVRRRETIAMTPANCVIALRAILENGGPKIEYSSNEPYKTAVHNTIKEITGALSKVVVGSSGLSIQYAIVMGLIHNAKENYPDKDIKIVVPPNCYGGTNDQARRIAACLDNVEVVDLPVDGNYNMVDSVAMVLDQIANENAVPYIIAEIPTNPRVEVPVMNDLRDALSTARKTSTGETAIDPVFILDQTFCPNVSFLRDEDTLSSVRTISYVSGSKFPSGGLCTAGYCVANKKAESLMDKINLHLTACDNEATHLQYKLLAQQMPSMNQRIYDAYINTRDFVNYIQKQLPEAKINFVSEELAQEGFTPSVFSMDLPTKGNTEEEREAYKRELNLKLINAMINEIPEESKYCVSYGQLKGCYWTIPATSTQGTTKEGDKDYIVRVAFSPDLDLEQHKQVFLDFVNQM